MRRLPKTQQALLDLLPYSRVIFLFSGDHFGVSTRLKRLGHYDRAVEQDMRAERVYASAAWALYRKGLLERVKTFPTPWKSTPGIVVRRARPKRATHAQRGKR